MSEAIVETKHDSTIETKAHITLVTEYLEKLVAKLTIRAKEHDQSKLMSPEKEAFDKLASSLKSLTYGSEEYNSTLEKVRPAIEHHWKNNRHHPEYHEHGLEDMNLVDIIELFCDWCAATHRHDDGDIGRSINVNAKRFKYPGLIGKIFINTCKEYEMGKNSGNARWAP